MEYKTCCRCKENRLLANFGKLSSTHDGLRYDCKDCRKAYRESVKDHIQYQNKKYYEQNKESVLSQNKQYRDNNKDKIRLHKKHLLKTDIQYKLRTTLQCHVCRIVKGQSKYYMQFLGCDIKFFKEWIEFQFDKYMSWENYGTYWHLDHILPLCKFDMTEKFNLFICLNWTNHQPLHKIENVKKHGKFMLHYYFNSIVSVHRYCQINKTNIGYQAINKSLSWLRGKLR
jgi:hypothetical protein